MSLLDLQAALQKQADAGQGVATITAARLTGASLTPRDGFDALLASSLGAPAGIAVTLNGKVPDPAGNVLALDGTVALLGLQGVRATLVFTQQPDGAVDLRVELPLGDGWEFARSFPGAVGYPFSGLELDDAHYVFTTEAGGTFAWKTQTISLSAGLNYVSSLGLGGSFSVLSQLVEELTGTVVLSGSVDPSSIPAHGLLPHLHLEAALASGVNALPDYFPLAKPRVRISTLLDENDLVAPWLTFVVSLQVDGAPLGDLEVALLPGWPSLGFFLTLAADVTPVTITRLLAGDDFTKAIPEELKAVFGGVALRSLAVDVDASTLGVRRINATIGSTGTWSMGQFAVDDVVLSYTLADPFGKARSSLFYFEAKARFYPELFKGEFELEMGYDTGSKTLQVGGGFTGSVSLSDVVKALSGGSVDLAGIGFDLTLEDFGAAFTRADGGGWEYTLHGDARAAFPLPLLGGSVEANLFLLADSAARSYQLGGGFAIGGSYFQATAELAADRKVLSASWNPLDPAETLGLGTLTAALGLEAPAIPPELDLNLSSVAFQYDFTHQTLALQAGSRTYGKAVLAARKSPGQPAAGRSQWQFFFGIGIPQGIDLTSLPLLHGLLDDDTALGVDQIQVVIASSGLDAAAARDINALISAAQGAGAQDGAAQAGSSPAPAARYPEVPAAGLPAGAGVSLVFHAGTHQEPVHLSLASGKNADAATPPPAAAASSAPPQPRTATDAQAGTGTAGAPGTAVARPAAGAANPSGAQGTWVDVQRSFGPVQVNRIGITLTPEHRVGLRVDAGVTLGGLSIGLSGLGADIPLQAPFTPAFTLAGLQVAFTAGEISAVGGLQRNPAAEGEEYTGELQVIMGSFGTTALGSYTVLPDRDTSLFAFLVVDAPLGGPPFLVVTGLAGGFGYNRALELPAIDRVATYPLVRGAMGTLGAADTRTELDEWIRAAPGQNWLAAGVRFTSFEMVKSFALLTASFGTALEFALLGESTLSVPAAADGDAREPVARADLAILVNVQPASGVVAASAQLSPGSYVFSKAARLTGGFAFYVWFGASPHAGDFVVTLGGYHPRFVPPAHYPQVPRLGLNWRVSEELTVKGGAYFALTPAVIMAGCSLNATWRSGNITAWFTTQADFLVRFKPFTYAIGVSVSIGVSVRVSLLVTTTTLTAHAGVALSLWGPPFGGTARVDISIASFTLRFGSGAPPAAAGIPWAEFRDSFLPPAPTAPTAPAAPGAPAPAASRVAIQAPTGILRSFSRQGEAVWAVSPGTLALAITTQVPSTAVAEWLQAALPAPAPWQTELGVGPMGAGAGSLSAVLELRLEHDGEAGDLAAEWVAAPVLASVPAGLWLNTAPALRGPATVDRALAGVTLVPRVRAGARTPPVPLDSLRAGAPPVRGFAWSGAAPARGEPYGPPAAMDRLRATLADPGVARSRAAILAALKGQGLSVRQTVDVEAFARDAPDLLFGAPSLGAPGQVPAAANA